MIEDDDLETMPLVEAQNCAVVMHRDAHFGGNFEIMLEYYQAGGKGICVEFEIEEIEALIDLQKNMGQDLASIILNGSDAEKVGRARSFYKALREVYEVAAEEKSLPCLIADLILSEENQVEEVVSSIIAKKEQIVPLLIDVLRQDDLYDPLFPGYGMAPALAARCLGMIGDKRAIAPLFEAIGEGDFFAEDAVLEALKRLGEPAKEFLLRALKGRPINNDTERAAMALIQFKEEADVATACLQQLQDKAVAKTYPLSAYLALGCEGLKEESLRQQVKAMISDTSVPSSVRHELKAIATSW